MPAGSVRAILALSVLALMWIMALKEPDKLPPVFVYLMFLKTLILVHYFAAHGKTIGPTVSARHALGLPRGSVRLLLIVGFVGLLAFLWNQSARIDLEQVKELQEDSKLFQGIILLLGGFFVGHVVTIMFRSSSGELPAWLQDVQAWLALLATVALVILVLIYAVINPSITEERRVNVDMLEAILAALIGFYFGARS
jgi:hypothetical protein